MLYLKAQETSPQHFFSTEMLSLTGHNLENKIRFV